MAVKGADGKRAGTLLPGISDRDVTGASAGARSGEPKGPGVRESVVPEGGGFGATLVADPAGRAGLVLVVATAVVAIAAPWLAPHDFIQLFGNFQPPGSPGHLLGTDSFGRDVLSYLLWGTRVSLLFGCGAAGISLGVGVLVGALPAYLGGVLDDLFSRFTEVFLVVPAFFLIIIVVALFGQNVFYSMVVVGLTIWPANARIVRAQVIALKSREYVRAARIAGASDARIIFRHILPNGIYPVVANATLQVGYAVLFEASLSFLGLGDPNRPSWGQLLFVARQDYATAWWVAFFPGVAIATLVVGINLLGDGINRALAAGTAPDQV